LKTSPIDDGNTRVDASLHNHLKFLLPLSLLCQVCCADGGAVAAVTAIVERLLTNLPVILNSIFHKL